MKRSLVLGTVTGVLWPLAVGVPADAVGETCHGVPATHVGTPGGSIIGTDGPDVIVTAGARTVESGGGDDLVCTTASGPASTVTVFSVRVMAGSGNDVVDRRGDTDLAAVGFVSGGSGQDVLLGAPGADSVSSDDGEHDVVSTYDGADSVLDGAPGGAPSADPDNVDLGPGNDSYSPYPPYSSALTVVGGDGRDALIVTLPTRGAFTVDASVGRFSGAGTAFPFTSFEAFATSSVGRGTWRFVGSDADESVLAHGDFAGATMGGGDDDVRITHAKKGPRPSVAGGRGQDRIEMQARNDRLVVDLRHGRYRIPGGDHGRLTGFENAEIDARNPLLTGTPGPNELVAVGCRRGTVEALAGADVVTAIRYRARRCNPGPGPRADGGRGADSITGSRVADLIIGGPGRDTADALGGRDTCRSVEVRTSCERP